MTNNRLTGTSVYGIRMPILTAGADIATIITDELIKATQTDYQPLSFNERDIIGITESLLARSQNNFVQLDEVAQEVQKVFPTGDVAIAFPILSRNRFAKILAGLAKGVSGKVYVCLSYPSDEVGNPVLNEEALFETDINPYADVLTDKEFYEKFGPFQHPITKTDYIELYKSVSPNVEILLLNNPKDILKYTNQIIVASIHKRFQHKKMLQSLGAKVIGLDDICNQPSQTSGWSEYGLLGSNYSTENTLKLFPHDATGFCETVQSKLFEKTGKKVEVLVYGDGGFKCPATHIWEFADPVVSPGYTSGLNGMPHEIKIKAVADNNTDNPTAAIEKAIQEKVGGNDAYTLGTTPRRITDLVGSLCDLTSGSGDKGTPVVVIKGYFDDYLKGNPTV